MTAIITNNQPVIICTSCGKGFLVRPREGVDLDPVWRVNKGPEAGVCGGEIRIVERVFAMKIVEVFLAGKLA